jgi:dCTP deaminase
MGVLPDWMIERDIKITPFSPPTSGDGRISFGVTSYGYDVRLGYKFKVFDVIGSCQSKGVINPKDFDTKALREIDLSPLQHHNWEPPGTGRPAKCLWCDVTCTEVNKDMPCPGVPNYIVIPPNSFALGESLEHFDIPRDVLCIVMGKSTYARCSLVVNVTPGEPEWKGHWTIEMSNTSPLPIMVFAGEGIMQAIFIRTDGHSEAALNATRRLCGQEFQGPASLHMERRLQSVEEQLHKDLSNGTCRQSYADKKGKYQDQKGLTNPIVEKHIVAEERKAKDSDMSKINKILKRIQATVRETTTAIMSQEDILEQARRNPQLAECGACGQVHWNYNPCPPSSPKPTPPQDPAVARAMELMYTKLRDLPPLALQYRDHLCRTLGICMETCITAFAHYAQAVEGLSCYDAAYIIGASDTQWFRDYIQEEGKQITP